MNLASVKPGDIVEIDRKGRRYFARVLAHSRSELEIQPLSAAERGLTHGSAVAYGTATARTVIGVWHANRATRARQIAASDDEQATA
jgi:hypothetical protein